METDRWCSGCGKQLVRRNDEKAWKFRVRKTCDRACSLRAAQIAGRKNMAQAQAPPLPEPGLSLLDLLQDLAFDGSDYGRFRQQRMLLGALRG